MLVYNMGLCFKGLLNMKLIFIGSGYVGLVSGVMFASIGHDVCCIDNDKSKIDSLKSGKVPIYEPGLEEYLSKAVSDKKLTFAYDYSGVGYVPDAVFITVGTPQLETGEANLSYVKEAVLEAARNTAPETIIVVKSTVPPGTSDMLVEMLREQGFAHKIASNPEFLKEGAAIKDFMEPDRIVIGVEHAKAKMEKIYSYFHDNGYKILFTDSITAEMIKYASNSFLATKIAFINEMANLCEKTGADVDLLAEGMGLDRRIGRGFLKTGPGFGGSCFPKDILALEYLASHHAQPCYVLSAVIESNQKRKHDMVSKISKALGGVSGKNIAVLGLTFKAGTDDVRSSPAMDIAKLLAEEGAIILAYDPAGAENAKEQLDIGFADSCLDASKDASAIVILTEWQEFKDLDYALMGAQMKEKIIFDYRNILDAKACRGAGFKLYQLGKRNA